MPTSFTEGLHTAEFLLSEAKGSYSREQVTLAAGAAALSSGTLLGKVTATGKYVAYANGASDGSEVAAAILYAGAPDLAVDQKVAVISRAAEVYSGALVGLDSAARADLAAAGIVVRD
ncbi:head decoration protein [Cupriavidus sp. IK-TO18]|uniref:head decoration protein n=1 Tax=Cupriavidus sp. IK-TO18 TaxID=2782182 RepID=UPI001898ABE0|nr:head decoration protein [Cupriavidus sp. IK-TO18]MBF6987250.1 head decoration protein [Cupriavidus sp. IK-TO18]